MGIYVETNRIISEGNIKAGNQKAKDDVQKAELGRGGGGGVDTSNKMARVCVCVLFDTRLPSREQEFCERKKWFGLVDGYKERGGRGSRSIYISGYRIFGIPVWEVTTT